MTQHTNQARHAHHRAIAVLLAAVALPATAYGQDTVTPPTVPVPSQQAPAPAPTAQTPPGESRTPVAPGVAEAAAQEDRERAAAARAERAEARRQQRAARPAPRAEAPARPVAAPAPAPVVAPEPAAPVAAAPQTPPPAEVTPPPAEPVAPVESSVAPEPAAEPGSGGNLWLILAGIGLAAAAIAAFLLLRPRRRDEDVAYEAYQAEPVAVQPEPVRKRTVGPAPRVADPVAAAPIFVAPRREPEVERTLAPVSAGDDAPLPGLENPELVKPDAEDINAVLGGAKPHGERPRLELAMRPTRAGMSRRGAMVEFELTVANAGGAVAEDVRIGAFMLGESAAASTEIERLLMHPPADQVVPAERIEPGGGTRLNAAVTLPREAVDAVTHEGDEGFTPVLVADARYRLPDGREGRTAAAFTIGRINGGEHLVPIALQDDPAMYADIEARLFSVAAKV